MTAGHPPLPPPPPAWPDGAEVLPAPPRPDLLGLEGSPGLTALAAAAAVGVAMDLTVRAGLIGVAAALLFLLAAAGLVVGARPTNPQALVLAGLAPLFGVWFAVRTSPWLLPFDALAAAGLLAVAASLARGGSVWDLRFTDLVVRATYALGHGVAAPGVLVRAARLVAPAKAEGGEEGRASRSLGIAVGVLLAVPLVVVFGALLASADPVFASFFDPVSLLGHVVLIVLGAWLAAALVRLALAKQPARPEVDFRWLSASGAVTVLVAIDALFAAFAAAQLVALSEGGRKVIETAGLTWAEYARSGFFQLLAVASLTVVVVLTLRGWAKADGRPGRLVTWLGVLTVGLTMTLVVVAFRRLDLYIDTFGLTMLRLFSSLFTVWVGVVLALLAAALVWPALSAARAPAAGSSEGTNPVREGSEEVRLRRRGQDAPPRAWFGPVAAAAGLALLLALNVVNPEALVVRHNVQAAGRPDPEGTRAVDTFDPEYAARLSDDAIPTVVASLPSLSAEAQREALVRIGCDDPPLSHSGWAAWNWSRAEAERARDRVCPAGGSSP
jgi:hypothetical protein